MLNTFKIPFLLNVYVLVFHFALSTIGFAQDSLKNYPGIPIIAGLDFNWAYPDRSADINNMKSAGIYALSMNDVTNNQMSVLSNWQYGGFQVLPVRSIDQSSNQYNWIVYYTDAKYTVWEPEKVGSDTSYLQHDSTVMQQVSSGSDTYLKLRPDSSGIANTLIWGPYYNQNVYEISLTNTLEVAQYTADFRMKLELNDGHSDNINTNTPLCKIKVTQSYLDYSWSLGCKDTIESLIITRGDFGPLNTFDDYSLVNYTLESEGCTSSQPPVPPQYAQISYSGATNDSSINKFLKMRDYIEFQVEWLGVPNYSLCIDKITVHDQKGYNLIVGNTFGTKAQIDSQLASLSQYNSNITGWIGIDEPNSIDKYAPIKKVNQILSDASNARPLRLALMGKWDGVFENQNNIFGVYHLSPWKEMEKRIGSMKVWQDIYYLDYPYRYNYGGSDTACNCPDFRAKNIELAAELNYKQAYNLDNNFGVSIQCGEIHVEGVAEQRNIYSHELMYEINLALMYGAKFFSLYTYFAQRDTDDVSGYTKHGIIDSYRGQLIYTPKYYMLKDTINPRLKGLFGKTIKTLIPTVDSLGMNATIGQVINANFINKVQSGSGTCFVDVGFFDDPSDGDKKYFMLLNRYYSDQQNMNIYFQGLTTYKNWEVTDFVDTSKVTILANQDGTTTMIDTIPKGDGKLYSVLPVIIYGGKIKYNETISQNVVLTGELTVESGATLTISANYDIYKNITVNSGGSIVVSAGAQLKFYDGSSLIVNGVLTANGSSGEITFDFVSHNSTNQNGIKVSSTGSLNISYSLVKNAWYGIYANYKNISLTNSEIKNCNRGLFLSNNNSIGASNIFYNNIHDNTYGIWLNYSSPNIRDNDIYNNAYGIYGWAYSSAKLGDYNNQGNNNIYSNGVGIQCYYNSNMQLGEDECGTSSGYNRIYGNTSYAARVELVCNVIAQRNWWGTANPPSSLFFTMDEGYIDYSCPLPNDPLQMRAATTPEEDEFNNAFPENSSPSKTVNTPIVYDPKWPISRKLQFVRSLIYLGKNDFTQKICKEIISENPDSALSFFALDILWESYRLPNEAGVINTEGFKEYLKDLTRNNFSSDLYASCGLILAGEDKDYGIDLVNSIANIHSSKFLGEIALFQKFMYYLLDKEDRNNALNVLKQLNQNYPKSRSAIEANNLFGNGIELPKVNNISNNLKGEIPLSFELLGNYPNPFNPITTISYALPYQSSIDLIIYDLMGRKIKSFSIPSQTAGYQNVIWDGTNNFGSTVASGIYMYRIKMKSLETNDTFEKTEKLIMLK